MRAISLAFFGVLACGALLGTGCQSRGTVTFTIQAPDAPAFSPLGANVSAYAIYAPDDSLIGVVSENSRSPRQLPLGPLRPILEPTNLSLQVLSGAVLVGMARLRDVTIKPGRQETFVAQVRKPLVFIGSALPDEGGMLRDGEIFDPVSGSDLAHPAQSDTPPPQLPVGMAAAAVTSSGRFLLAGRTRLISIYDTGTGSTVGSIDLSFSPQRVAVAPVDRGAAAIGRTGEFAIWPDVDALTTAPNTARVVTGTLMNETLRALAWAPDGGRLYVLTGGGGGFDPCDPDATPHAGAIYVLDREGTVAATWTFGMVDAPSDLSVDPVSGTVLVSQPGAQQVGSLAPDTASGAVTATRLFGATCPAALYPAAGRVTVATGGRNVPDGERALVITGSIATPTDLPDRLSVPLPTIKVPINSVGGASATVTTLPGSFFGYELAVTPDQTRAILASRAHYVENGIMLGGCFLDIDVVEYGVYTIDLRTGQANYDVRSQTISPNKGCQLDCGIGPPIPCSLQSGDRAAGIAALFGAP